MVRQRFAGRIAGLGTSSGVRIVVGRWDRSPFGAFADVMVERRDGHRLLFAPSEQIATYIAATYTFDEVVVASVVITGDDRWRVLVSDHLDITFTVGSRTGLGWLLRAVPRRLATSPWLATAVDPIARRLLRGVRTTGSAGHDRKEWYGATDVRAVTELSGILAGADLGTLADVDPPCRFGFSSTPRRPGVVTLVTTVAVASLAPT